jgi:hypothetical protein
VNVEEEESGVKKRGEDETKLKSILDILQENNNNDILFIKAENLYKKQNCGRSLELIKRMLHVDFSYLRIMLLYCACLIELEKTGDLYYLLHKLVTSSPHIAISWFALGSYYFLMKKFDIGNIFRKPINLISISVHHGWLLVIVTLHRMSLTRQWLLIELLQGFSLDAISQMFALEWSISELII